MRNTADYMMRVAGFSEIETRVFRADHALGETEVAALVVWWLDRPPNPGLSR
jgi:hypothetical protein